MWRFAPGEHQSTHLPDGHRLATTCLDVDFLKSVKIISQSEYLVLGELASSCNLTLCIFAKLENQIFLQSFLRFGSGLYTWWSHKLVWAEPQRRGSTSVTTGLCNRKSVNFRLGCNCRHKKRLNSPKTGLRTNLTDMSGSPPRPAATPFVLIFYCLHLYCVYLYQTCC